MPIVRTVKIEGSGPREVLLDISTGKQRKTLYNPLNPWTSFFLGTALAPVAIGVGRVLWGKSERDEAREALHDRALELKLLKQEADLEKTYAEIDKLRQPFGPRGSPLQEEQAEVLRATLPYELERRELDTEKMQRDLEERQRLFPLKEELQREALETARSLREEREARLGEFMKTQEAVREREAAEKGFLEERIQALREERERIKEALAPLPWWERSEYLREKYFPEEEQKRKQEPGLRVVRAIGHGVLQFGTFGGA